MLRLFITLITLFFLLPVSAGELENAISANKNVFLYMYTPTCGFCKKFEPRYEKLAKMYNQKYTFMKLNAETQYGYYLMRTFQARYVPFIVLLNGKKSWQIEASCLMESSCTEKALSEFLK